MTAPLARPGDDSRRRSRRRLLTLAALVLVAILLAANAHLVYVAFSSQPDCVPHPKGEGEHGPFRAAKSAC